MSLQTENLLLRSLGDDTRQALAMHCSRVVLEEGTCLAPNPNEPTRMLFVNSGIVSILFERRAGTPVHVAMIGREGMANYHRFLDPASRYEISVRLAGDAIAIEVGTFAKLAVERRDMQFMMLRYASSIARQVAENLSSSIHDPIDMRLSRYLLMYQDRSGSEEIMVLHSDLASMFGVRRATITDSMHRLEGQRAIRNSRGRVVIEDRTVLEDIADNCYDNERGPGVHIDPAPIPRQRNAG